MAGYIGNKAVGLNVTTGDILGDVGVGGDLSLGDNDKAIFGAGSDLQIFHDGSNSFISDTGAGSLILRGSTAVALQGANGENGIIVTENGAVDLRYNNSTKLATTNTGVAVTGAISASSGNVTITDGNLVVAAGHGIDFAATNNNGVSTPSELLSDYEEGTWSPVLKFGASSTGIAQASAAGRYTKIGKMVLASFNILLSDKGSQTGLATVTGLPFAHFAAVQHTASNLTFESNGASANQIGAYAMPWTDSNLYLRYQVAATYGEYTNANFTDTTKLFAMVTYESPS